MCVGVHVVLLLRTRWSPFRRSSSRRSSRRSSWKENRWRRSSGTKVLREIRKDANIGICARAHLAGAPGSQNHWRRSSGKQAKKKIQEEERSTTYERTRAAVFWLVIALTKTDILPTMVLSPLLRGILCCRNENFILLVRMMFV